jgi:hypothetical protein
MAKHVSISPKEEADRPAIRELIEAYPHCAELYVDWLEERALS